MSTLIYCRATLAPPSLMDLTSFGIWKQNPKISASHIGKNIKFTSKKQLYELQLTCQSSKFEDYHCPHHASGLPTCIITFHSKCMKKYMNNRRSTHIIVITADHFSVRHLITQTVSGFVRIVCPVSRYLSVIHHISCCAAGGSILLLGSTLCGGLWCGLRILLSLLCFY